MLQALAGATGGILQAGLGYKAQKMTNEANMKLAEYAYSRDLDMWNRQNKYNSPTEQMERLRSAGLNPNLVYGQGAVANTGGQMPKYNAPTLDYNYVPPVQSTAVQTISNYQDFQMKQAQIDNLREQNKVIQEEAKIRSFRNFLNDLTKDEQVDKWSLTNEGLGLRNANLALTGKGLRQNQYWKDVLNENINLRDDLRNQLFIDTYAWQKGIFSNKYKQGLQNLATGSINQRRLKKQIELMDQQLQQRGELFPSQLDYQKQKVLNLGRSFELMEFQKDYLEAQKNYKQLEIDTYMYQMYGNFAEKAMRAINQMNMQYHNYSPRRQGSGKWSKPPKNISDPYRSTRPKGPGNSGPPIQKGPRSRKW